MSYRQYSTRFRAAGTVTNVKEAIAWLSYTYLYVRMMQNPLPYGLSWQELAADPRLDARRCDWRCCSPVIGFSACDGRW
jgi:hypothetical protein